MVYMSFTSRLAATVSTSAVTSWRKLFWSGDGVTPGMGAARSCDPDLATRGLSHGHGHNASGMRVKAPPSSAAQIFLVPTPLGHARCLVIAAVHEMSNHCRRTQETGRPS